MTAVATNAITPLPTNNTVQVAVSSADCRAPAVTILNNSTFSLAPNPYYRSDTVIIQSEAELNCSGIVNTK